MGRSAQRGRSTRPHSASRWSSMNATITSLGGRAPPGRNTPTPSRRISLARFSSTTLALQRFSSRARRWSGRRAGRRHVRPGGPNAAAFRSCSRLAGRWRRSPPTASRVRRVCSCTIRTNRSRTSGEYLLGRAMGSILSTNGPSDKPGTIHDRTHAVTSLTVPHLTWPDRVCLTAVPPTGILPLPPRFPRPFNGRVCFRAGTTPNRLNSE